jgi:hypothetical protein
MLLGPPYLFLDTYFPTISKSKTHVHTVSFAAVLRYNQPDRKWIFLKSKLPALLLAAELTWPDTLAFGKSLCQAVDVGTCVEVTLSATRSC